MALLSTLILPVSSATIEPTYSIESTFLTAEPRLDWEENVSITPPLATTTAIISSPPRTECLCVRFAREQGLNLPYQNAEDIKPNSGPRLGGAILFKYGHISVIKAFLKDGYWVQESNYSKCKIGYRLVKYNDPAISGFWANP